MEWVLFWKEKESPKVSLYSEYERAQWKTKTWGSIASWRRFDESGSYLPWFVIPGPERKFWNMLKFWQSTFSFEALFTR